MFIGFFAHIINQELINLLPYNREKAVEYAKEWALKRNPAYYNFDGIGGDCTNFASQCLFAGAGVMNYTRDIGWYYNSPYDRAAAWSGAQYFNNFMTRNKSTGLIAAVQMNLELGDFIQLNNGIEFYHTLVVTGFQDGEILVCTHTDDSYMRPFSTYYYTFAQGLHIVGVNI